MKKLILFFAVLFFGCEQNSKILETKKLGENFSINSRDEIFFRNKKIFWTKNGEKFFPDAASFRVLKNNFAVDKNHSFFGEKKLSHHFDAASFQIIENTKYGFDKNYIYFGDKFFDFVLFESLEKIGGTYLKDARNFFYFFPDRAESKILSKISSKNFLRVFEKNLKFAAAKNHVFFAGKIVDGANPQNFEILKFNFARDGEKIFWENFLLPLEFSKIKIISEKKWPTIFLNIKFCRAENCKKN